MEESPSYRPIAREARRRAILQAALTSFSTKGLTQRACGSPCLICAWGEQALPYSGPGHPVWGTGIDGSSNSGSFNCFFP